MGEVGEIDAAFIQEPEDRPKPSMEAQGIPLIDLSAVVDSSSSSSSDHPEAIEKVVREIGNACKDWGFFQVANHGVPIEIRQKMETAARQFFVQPLELKMKVRRDDPMVFGYYEAERTKNVRDWREVFDFTARDHTFAPASPDPEDKELREWIVQWPDYPTDFKDACEEYSKEVEKLSLKLMELIAVSLGLRANRFSGFFEEHTSIVRMIHYPPCPSPYLALGVGHHKDGGVLTVLAQDDVGGLEVKRKTDGEWIRVKPIPDVFVINIGDILQVWSNDRYESVEHRVQVNSEKERLSIPFFLNPAHHTIVKPLEELTDHKNPSKFRPYNWGKFIADRKISNFKKVNRIIEINHFKL